MAPELIPAKGDVEFRVAGLRVTERTGQHGYTVPAWRDTTRARRSGPRFLDSGLSEIFTVFHAAALATTLKYTASGVRRSSAA
jgi:hypothetical protein